MTLSTQLLALGITDAKIAPVTANTSSSYTIGAYTSIPGIKSVDVTAKTNSKEATGDEKIMGNFIIKQGFDIKFENQMLDLAAIALINGSTLTQTGTTPNQVNSLIDKGSDVPAIFNLNFKTNYVQGQAADTHFEYYCVSGILEVGVKSGDYYSCSFTGTAYARMSDGAFRNQTLNETVTDIAIPGSLTLTSNIVKTNSGGTIGGTLAGTTFLSKAAAETIGNYTIAAGTTGLTVSAITYINPTTVVFTCTGTAAAGTISITPKIAACTNGLAATAGTFVIAP
ncbi:MAG: hypothetical protein WCY19_05010 [Candidatus Gastranaerophilaceae bacterium]